MSSFALAAVSVVAALGFTRIFETPETALVPAGGALLVHAVVRIVLPRHGSLATVAAVLATGILYAAWTVEPATTWSGVPTPATLSALQADFTTGFEKLQEVGVPVAGSGPLLFLALLGTWLAAAAAEWVTATSKAVLSALLPAVTMFTVTASLGTDQHQAVLTGGLVAACLLFVILHSPAHTGGDHTWFSGAVTAPGRLAVLRAGLPLVLVAAVAAPLLGPRLPDARSAGLVERDGAGGPRTRVTVSPLVDIRDRLRQDPPVEVFTVQSPTPAYWRLAALDAFDGQIWSSLASYRSASGNLPAADPTVPAEPVTQRFSISNLSQFWLPAAYRPVSIDLDGARVNPETTTLLTEEATSDGLTYDVVSAVPRYTAADFQARAPALAAPESARQYTELPADLRSGRVAQLAHDVVGPRITFYDRSLALQRFFREEFTYSEEVPAGHSDNHLEAFLFEHRTGFCEQFSAAFAVMARSLGMPARVAVGFQSGTRDDAGVFHVTSTDAHAWPEVHIEPFGWVAFEPTPTRHDPSPANHTGTYDPAAQAPANPPTTVTTAPSERPVTETTDVATPTTVPGAGAGSEGGQGSEWPRRIGLVAAAAVAGGVATGLLVLALRRRRRAARRRQPDTRAAVLAAWEELVERLDDEGLEVGPTHTAAEVETLVAARLSPLAPPLAELRPLVDQAAYAPSAPERVDVVRAWRALDTAVATLDAREPRASRVRRILDPRSLRP